MKISTLNLRNPCVDLEEIADHEALFEGGKKFFSRLRRLLPQRPQEGAVTYDFRCRVAHYLNYAAQIVGYFVGGLFSSRIDPRTHDGSSPSWLPDFLRNCDRADSPFETVLRRLVSTAHVKRRAWALVDFPEARTQPQNLLEWNASRLGEGYLCELETECVLDWERDEQGAFEWVIVHERSQRRADPTASRDTVREVWRVFYKTHWERYEISYEAKGAPSPDTEVNLVASGPSATPGVVPVVCLEFPSEITLMSVIYSGVLETIRKRNALSWSLDRSAYAMPIFKLADDRTPEVFGAGYGLKIGIDESVEWSAPPGDAFSPLKEYAEDAKNETFRTAHAMALALNNSGASVGRSEGSKQMDFDALNTVLVFMGKHVLKAINHILNLLSLGRGEKERWQCDGMSRFNSDDLTTLFDNAIKAQTLAIDSKTFNRLNKTRLAFALTPQATQEERVAMAQEIENAVETAPAIGSLVGVDEENAQSGEQNIQNDMGSGKPKDKRAEGAS